MIADMGIRIRFARSLTFIVLMLGCVLCGCRVEGEFDPDFGRKDADDTVYRTPVGVPK